MQLEEAKKIVKSECYAHNLLNLDRTLMINEALDTIIEHAVRQSCEDLISRTDLIATMHLIMDDAVIGDNDEDYECLEDVKQQYLAIAEGLRGFQLLGAENKRGSIPINLQEWLSTFNTDSATECFTAVQRLKEKRSKLNEQ